MSTQQPPWLRGPVPGVPAVLQPVAHALIDADEDTHKFLAALTPEQLSIRPGGAASAAYHVRHAMGSLDRLFTYARGEALSDAQLGTLQSEKTLHDQRFDADALAKEFAAAIEQAHDQLWRTTDADLMVVREVGRAKLPANTLALLFHAAEHTARHVGQLGTTVKVIKSGSPSTVEVTADAQRSDS